MRFPLRLGLREAGYADGRASSGLARRREFARNAREQDTAKPSRPRRNPALISQQSGFGLAGLTPNLRGMSAMDPFVFPSMPSERRYKLPQKPPPGMTGGSGYPLQRNGALIQRCAGRQAASRGKTALGILGRRAALVNVDWSVPREWIF